MEVFEKLVALPKYHRRLFILLLISVCIVLGLLDYFVLQNKETFAHIVSHYAQSIIEVILAGLLILWLFNTFTPYGESRGGLEQIEPYRITAEFDAMLEQAHRWRYKGNFGRYERGKVLPTLAGKPNAHASISVIDPRDEKLCRKHANYRNTIQAIDKGRVYDALAVALEVTVTIVHCAWYVASRKIDIDLYLSTVFDPVRIDSNDDSMVLTVEDRRSPALKLTKLHFMYNHFELQMRYTREQADHIKLDGLALTQTVAALSAQDIESFLNKAGLGELCKRLTPESILTACREAKNPYES